jgi:hypothetical protein
MARAVVMATKKTDRASTSKTNSEHAINLTVGFASTEEIKSVRFASTEEIKIALGIANMSEPIPVRIIEKSNGLNVPIS